MKIVDINNKLYIVSETKYKELKAQYPSLPFYPNYDFGYSLEDYYESSTCW